MSEIIPFLQGHAFGPDALRAMSTALEDACRMLKVDHDQGAREAMAVRIIELARNGECDPERLRDRVLQEAGATASVVDAANRDAVSHR
jgi:arginase family enzyme